MIRENVAIVPGARDTFFDSVRHELTRAYAKHGTPAISRHEFYAILLEEMDELWDAIKTDQSNERVVAEAIQVAAMCVRFYETTADLHNGNVRT